MARARGGGSRPAATSGKQAGRGFGKLALQFGRGFQLLPVGHRVNLSPFYRLGGGQREPAHKAGQLRKGRHRSSVKSATPGEVPWTAFHLQGAPNRPCTERPPKPQNQGEAVWLDNMDTESFGLFKPIIKLFYCSSPESPYAFVLVKCYGPGIIITL